MKKLLSSIITLAFLITACGGGSPLQSGESRLAGGDEVTAPTGLSVTYKLKDYVDKFNELGYQTTTGPSIVIWVDGKEVEIVFTALGVQPKFFVDGVNTLNAEGFLGMPGSTLTHAGILVTFNGRERLMFEFAVNGVARKVDMDWKSITKPSLVIEQEGIRFQGELDINDSALFTVPEWIATGHEVDGTYVEGQVRTDPASGISVTHVGPHEWTFTRE